MGTRTIETKGQGRAVQMSYTNVHKTNLGSQLGIFDTGLFTHTRPRLNEFTQMPSNDSAE